jgi:hypothetical protein
MTASGFHDPDQGMSSTPLSGDGGFDPVKGVSDGPGAQQA